ncbi:MAG: sensor histidine kinase [Chloroflexota bacterium]|nr:MAG: sensor histidine kinase [Chloroflexota bacterium]
MTQNSLLLNRFSPPLRLILGVIFIVLVSLWGFYMLMRPPQADLSLMGLLLALTAGGSAVAGYAADRLGWFERAPALRWSLLGGYILSSLMTFLNVWVTARLMFFNQHDLLLATVLLGFATGISIVLGHFLTSALVNRIGQLRQAAQAVAQGDFSARTHVHGRDELALLAQTFNDMAGQLQAARQRQSELERLRRDLIAWVSHDLQTPLASIRVMVEALADGMVDDPETAQRYLRTIEREIQGLSILIDDLFQMAQIDAGGLSLDRQMNSLSDLVSDTLEAFSEQASQRQVELFGKVDPDVDPVWMDSQRVGRVLDNLVANALRHTPPGGKVQVLVSRQGDVAQVDVSDSGPGIAPADLPNVFERFYRGEKSRSRQTGGAGLGLAIARGIVEAHGGQISVESTPGQGANFCFILPSGSPDSPAISSIG